MATPIEHEVAVVGAGQAGLSMSYYLSAAGIDHVVLERARVGERWRSERWDSLRFQFPNRYVRLPGFDYDGDEPEGFMGPTGIVDVLDRYADHIRAPVRCGVDVQALELREGGGFLLTTNAGAISAQQVVLATGPYQHTLVPELSRSLPAAVRQLPASAFTNARALPEGGVLVVGSGGSGVQIAEDLIAAGRDTWLCVGDHRRVPRSYRGRDLMDWFEELGMTTAPAEDGPPAEHSPLITGVDGGYEVDLRRLVAAGGHLLGRLEGVDDGVLQLGDQLLAHIEAGDQAYRDFVAGLEQMAVARGEADGPAPPPPPAPGPLPPEPPRTLDLDAAGITSVIWATGYRVDFSWVGCGEYRPDGLPVQSRGVSTEPGLYFIGLPFMHTVRSSFFWGAGDDARYLADYIAGRR